MTIRNIIFWIHLLTGVILGAIIGFMSITGIILAFEPQITDYAERNIRYVTPVLPGPLAMDTLLAKVKEQAGNIKVNSIALRADPKSSVVLALGKEGGSLYVNPYTGEVLGKGSKVHEWMHVVEDLHRWLGNRKMGRPFTGAAVMAFFVLLVTGIYVWWPTKTMAFKLKLKGRARDWNWHNVIGFWLSPILLVTIITGMIMAHQWANSLLYRATGNQPPAVTRSPGEDPSQGPRGESKPPVINLDTVVSTAQQQAPEWVSMTVRLPREEGKPVTISIQEKLAADVLGRSQLSLDSVTYEVVKWEPLSQSNLGAKLRVWVKYLHTGEAFGPVHQFVAALAALGAVFLVWTGFALAWRRFFKK